MIVPTRRWLVAAALLALVAPLAFRWPAAGSLLVTLDALWLLALLIDGWRALALRRDALEGMHTRPLDLAHARRADTSLSCGRV